MKISDVQSVLSKALSTVGDCEVLLKDVGGGAQSVLHSFGFELGAGGDPTASTLTLNHGPATQQSQPESSPAVEQPQPQS